MSKPTWSLGQSFSQLGRLENACAGALADSDTPRALDRLRQLHQRFESLGAASAPLWLSYLGSVLDERFLPHLDEVDFDRLEAFAEQLAAAGAVTSVQSRWLIVEASAGRGSTAGVRRAQRLLTEIYQALWTPDDDRSRAAARLAALRALDDQHLAVYADLLSRDPHAPAEVSELFADVMNVGFDSDTEHVRRAYELATAFADPTASAITGCAFGLGELLLHERPQSAVQAFTIVLAQTEGHPEAVRALLSAHLHAREFATAVTSVQDPGQLSPRCSDLLALCQFLAWLDAGRTSTTTPNRPPVTAARLAEIEPGADVGPWRNYALGRAHLIEGDAEQAQYRLSGLLYSTLPDSDLHYQLAWAHLLCRNPQGVRTSYRALAGAAGSWALGCLLQDAEPGKKLPAPLPKTPRGFEHVAKARQAFLTNGPLPATLDLQGLIESGACEADLFEALRTALGVAAVSGRLSDSDAIRHPLYARLPAAERLIWSALSIRVSDPEASRAMLRQALDMGHDRAAILLAQEAVGDGRPEKVDDLLGDVRGPKRALLVGHAAALLALREAVTAWAAEDDDSAQDHAQRAMAQLTGTSTAERDRFEASLLELTAETLTTAPEPAALAWQKVAAQPWTARLLGLARLIRAPESVDADLARRLPAWLATEAHHAALTQAALRVVLLSDDDAARQEATSTLIRLGEDPAETLSGPLKALVAASRAAAESDLDEARRLLRAAESDGAAPDQAALVAVLANALEGKAPPNKLPFAAPTPAPVATALAAAAATAQAEAGNPEAAANTLLQACLAHKQEIDGLLDLQRALPHLIQLAARRGRREVTTAALEPALRQALADERVTGGIGGIGNLAVACYATLLGDFDEAEQAWRSLLEQTPADNENLAEIRREYGRFLCHQAVRAYLDGDHLTVFRRLQMAELYVPDKAAKVFADLESEKLVNTLINRLFRKPPEAADRRGRHPRLAELIAANPDLKRALKSGAGELVLNQWRLASMRAGHDIELWHTVAVLAREDALARPTGPLTTDQARTTATVLWTMLLADPALREHFAQLTLPGQADDAFRDEIVEALLADQKTRLTKAMAADDQAAVAECLRCMGSIQQGLTASKSLLGNGPFVLAAGNLEAEEADFAPFAARAEKLLDEWGTDLVASAQRTLTDTESIRRLGEDSKIDKNYEAALDELKLALSLERPPTGVLYAALDWGYDWFLAVHDQKDDEAASACLDAMSPFAKRLTPRCTPGRGHAAENKALGWFSYACGLSASRAARKAGGTRRAELFTAARDLHEKSLAWNSEWDPPKRALCRSEGERLFALGEHAEAERVLQGLNDDNEQIGTLYNNLAIDRLRDARSMLRIAKSADHVEAVVELADEFERMQHQAVRFSPEDPVIRGNLQYIEEIRDSIARKRQELA